MGKVCDVLFKNIVWCHSENNAPHHLKNVKKLKILKMYLRL